VVSGCDMAVELSTDSELMFKYDGTIWRRSRLPSGRARTRICTRGVFVSGGPELKSAVDGERLVLAAVGPWTAAHSDALERTIDETVATPAAARKVEIDMSGIDRLDTFGAWLLERLRRTLASDGREAVLVGVSDDRRGLIEDLQKVNLEPAESNSHLLGLNWLAAIGATMAEVTRSFLLLAQMLGEVSHAGVRALIRPGSFRLTSTVHHLDRVGWRAVPIILLITFLIGAIIAQQGIFHFRRFGAEVYVVDMVGVLVLREIGVLIVCIMVAGRSGSAYTAELGAMKMREEIDALRTMGFDPVEVLILPRIVAIVIAVPILTFLGSMAALYGGGLVCWLYGGMNPDIFLSRLKESISLNHFVVGMVKAPFMAMMIGIVACVEGLQVKGSADSLGSQTTASVVKSIFLVIVLDGFFAIFFASMGK
jgi:phospholipid/cholesterol/gamma-HCH transport system permease protein